MTPLPSDFPSPVEANSQATVPETCPHCGAGIRDAFGESLGGPGVLYKCGTEFSHGSTRGRELSCWRNRANQMEAQLAAKEGEIENLKGIIATESHMDSLSGEYCRQATEAAEAAIKERDEARRQLAEAREEIKKLTAQRDFAYGHRTDEGKPPWMD